MKKVTILLGTMMFALIGATSLYAQTAVSVTMTVNTATMPDTLMPDHVVQIRGEVKGADAASTGLASSVTWDSQSLSMTNVGGDYWSIDFDMSPGDTLNYKFWAGSDAGTGLKNGSETGWESGDNNVLIMPTNASADTTLPLQWYETKTAPFTPHADSVTVYFRVNVGAQVQSGSFNPTTDKIGVRGNPDFFDNPGDWSSSAFYLEEDAVNGLNYLYSGSTKIHKDSVANFDSNVIYKFVIEGTGDPVWEGDPNREFAVADHDTTLAWDYFNRTAPSEPIGEVDPVTVTFMVNTATMPDTLMEDHVIQLRGGVSGQNAAGTDLPTQITWDSGTLNMTNVGGDYWTLSFDMSPGDDLSYKFWAGVNDSTALINGSEQGWESGSDNSFSLPANATGDTTVALQWYETREAPFTPHADSVTVYFRVNVGAQVQTGDFDPATDQVGVRGNPAFFDNPADWGSSAFFLAEDAVNGQNYFYSGSTKIHKDSVANYDSDMGFKFVIENSTGTVWESTADRFFSVPAHDSTLHWDYFSGTKPAAGGVLETNLGFTVDVGILEGLGLFNSAIDTVNVTGTFNSWNNTANRMDYNSFEFYYEAFDIAHTNTIGANVEYKYYIRWDASRDDESSENYFELISANDDGWEEPGVTGGGNRVLTIEDAADQPVQSDYFNGVAPQALMTEANTGGGITVTFRIDMSPALDADTPFLPASDSVFLSVETPFFALTNGLPTYSDDIATRSLELRDRMMFTDEDEDMIYELDLELMLPTLNHFGFNVAYGEPTSADGQIIGTGPGGTQPGRRFYQYVTPMVDATGTVTWPSTFTFPVLTWSDEDLPYDLPPDYTVVSNEGEGDVAEAFHLDQNYPNPFNPTTNIGFNLQSASSVKLTVYNVLGQKVATLIDGKQMAAGKHMVGFDARALSSGIYIYRIEAGNFTSTKRMTLIK